MLGTVATLKSPFARLLSFEKMTQQQPDNYENFARTREQFHLIV